VKFDGAPSVAAAAADWGHDFREEFVELLGAAAGQRRGVEGRVERRPVDPLGQGGPWSLFAGGDAKQFLFGCPGPLAAVEFRGHRGKLRAELVERYQPDVVQHRVDDNLAGERAILDAGDAVDRARHAAHGVDRGIRVKPVLLHPPQDDPHVFDRRAAGAEHEAALLEVGVEVERVLCGRRDAGKDVDDRARLGIVSAVAGEWRTPAGGRLERYLESDIALHPGFSGGLLLGADATALGVNTAGLARGASIAVAVETVRRVAEALLAHGRMRRGYLGIGTQPVALAPDLRTRVGQSTALIVLSVQPDSPAAKAGLLLGDVLLRAGEEPLTHPAALLPALDAERVGRELRLQVLRAGETREVAVVVGEREAA